MDSEGDFDICINCAAETRYGQSEQVVKLDVVLLGHNRTISPTNIKLLLNIGPGAGEGRKKEVKRATFPTLVTMIVGLTCSIFAMHYIYHVLLYKYYVQVEPPGGPSSFFLLFFTVYF